MDLLFGHEWKGMQILASIRSHHLKTTPVVLGSAVVGVTVDQIDE